jgi:hypothetical protein
MPPLTAELTMMDCTDCYAVPGAGPIIDVIDPRTDLTWCFHLTADEVYARDPAAVRMTVDDWTAQQVARQRTPWAWEPLIPSDGGAPERRYQEMLDVLPPAYWQGGIFAVGEAVDHDFATGRLRFDAYRQQGDRYFASSRPVTIAELKAGPTV